MEVLFFSSDAQSRTGLDARARRGISARSVAARLPPTPSSSRWVARNFGREGQPGMITKLHALCELGWDRETAVKTPQAETQGGPLI